METLISLVHIGTCVLLVLLVLLQSGKGAEISASFGGSSQTVFGASGGANFFTKVTAVLAALFMTTSVLLTVIASNKGSVFDDAPVKKAEMPSSTQAPAKAPTKSN